MMFVPTSRVRLHQPGVTARSDRPVRAEIDYISCSDAQKAEMMNLLTTRIYHEDMLSSQRTYNFITAHALLSGVFVLSLQIPENSSSWFAFSYIISLLGILLAGGQAALGKRARIALTVFRSYLRGIEESRGIRLDSALYLFFESGRVDLGDVGVIVSETRKKLISSDILWRWNVSRSANDVLAVGVPYLLVFFWICLLSILLYITNPCALLIEDVWVSAHGSSATAAGAVALGFLALVFTWFRGPASAIFQPHAQFGDERNRKSK
jgi:hypothetical protein